MAAMGHAVFPGGARIRPQLCVAVARACGQDAPELTDAAAVALEFMHCASLVHDDMPCFDDADTRRGLPTVHKQFGEPLALLTGDAPSGIVAGQAWECETRADLGQYQRAKTGALFVAATCSGALSAGADPQPWRALGECLGEAYQVADDIRDVIGQAKALGKPVGQDLQHSRPSAATDLGLGGAIAHFESLVQATVDAVPECAAASALRQLVRQESERLVPREACEKYRQSPATAGRQAA
jgi:geranylgeranyl diphosphate synthase type II